MKRLAACLVLVAVVSAATYVNSLANGFVLDDLETVVDNQAIRDWRNLSLLVSPRYFRQFGEFSYRPLATFTHFLDRGLWRLNPVGCHAVNVFLHALNAGLVSLVAFSMGRQVSAALAAGLIFSLHPVCSEVVNAVSFREDALTLAFLLLALLSYSRVFSGRSRGAGRRWYAISLLCHALSMLAKETGVLVLPLLVLRDLVGGALHRHARQSCFSEGTLLSAVNSKSEIRSTKQIQMTETAMTETGERRRPMPKRKAMFWSLGFGVLDLFRISCFGLRIWLRPRAALGSRGRLYLGYAALTAGYLFVRFHLFRNPMEAVAGKFAFHSLSGVCQIVAEYARLLLLPTNLTAHYVEPLPTGLATFVSLVFAFGLLMAVTGARSRLGWFGLAWVLIALAPVAAVSPPTGHILAERYAYVAAAGFCLGLSVLA
ncbi:MAG: hypothetical protein FJ272_15205, partial [Planctomycetes bacterium]|nr:hypothetical protein [Planctomycetota bacterium]